MAGAASQTEKARADQAQWNRFTSYSRFYPEVDMSLDVSRMSFPEGFFQSLDGPMKAAYAAMRELEAGTIANPDENRMVGHYWLRSSELAPDPAIRKEIEDTKRAIVQFASDLHSGRISSPTGGAFQDVIVAGIGGSALGPQLVADALGSKADKVRIHFCDNTDPDGIARLVEQLDARLQSTLVVVVSKSGGTVETRNGAAELKAALTARGLPAASHLVAVTQKGSKLDEQAKAESWLARFPMWDWVGGRTSLFSAVGLLPAALQGVDIEDFLKGAQQMDALTRREHPENPAMRLAAMWHFAGEGRGKKDMVVLPYKDRLVLFSKYLQQLVMESLGKERNLRGEIVHQGISVYGNKGSTDQHAYVQQLRDGVPNFFVTFIRVLQDFAEGTNAPAEPLEVEPGIHTGDYLQGFLLGTREALFENGRDTITLTINRLSAASLGGLIALYERAVGFYASLVGINAYHQPGVEAGKKAASRVIEIEQLVVAALKSSSGACSAVEVAKLAGVDDIETVFQVLQYLAANPARGVRLTPAAVPSEMLFTSETRSR